MNVLGLDVGGANIKISWVRFSGSDPIRFGQISRPFEIWKHKNRLRSEVEKMIRRFPKPDRVGLTMTAEVSDAFRKKSDGVRFVLTEMKALFKNARPLVFTSSGEFVSFSRGCRDWPKIASANWRATGEFVAGFVRDCVVVDMGSTTTDVIPIKGGKVVSSGFTDLERLKSGELVYTGAIRSNVAHIVPQVPQRILSPSIKKVESAFMGTSCEWFCCMGDVHLILNNIPKSRYSAPTPDGRPKTKAASLARLARLVCADPDEVSTRQLVGLARYIYDEQKKGILDAIRRVRSHAGIKKSAPLVAVGAGKFVVREMTRLGRYGLAELPSVAGKPLDTLDPSFAVAVLLGFREGRA